MFKKCNIREIREIRVQEILIRVQESNIREIREIRVQKNKNSCSRNIHYQTKSL